jgi:hypothetical protein
MKYGKSIVAAAAIATALSATSASALTTTIDFGVGPTSIGTPTLVFTGGGLTVTATPYVTDDLRNLVDASPAVVNSTHKTSNVNKGGLGESNAPGDTDHRIDGAILRNDLVGLVFNKAVKLKSVRFSEVDGSDVFDFYTSPGVAGYVFSAATPFPLAEYIFGGGGVIGSFFGFGATDRLSDYKIRSVTVSAVPLPPAALLLVTGLFGIGALGRRRTKSA